MSFVFQSIAQKQAIKVQYFYPKDSAKYAQLGAHYNYHYQKEQFGRTTMIIHCESAKGTYDFIFKKKMKQTLREIIDSNATTTYLKNNELDITSIHDLFAFVIEHKQNGVIEKVKFQDFGSEVYWPEFDYPNCLVSDEDKDGLPEFYLSYLCESDGLDPKDYKQIIYVFNKSKTAFIKAKATASYAVEEVKNPYTLMYDANWLLLPKAIQLKSKALLKKHKSKYKIDWVD
jgi:hypothetical protein